MGLVTIVGSIFIVASVVWGLCSFILIQEGAVRLYEPHFEYDTIPYWPYTTDFAGGRTNWFENLNYTNFQIDQPLPDSLLDRLNDTVFIVSPKDPGQLWRQESYDYYDGAGWSKTNPTSTRPLTSQELIPASAATNPIYTIVFTAPAGASVGTLELPTLFPSIRVIDGSFKTYTINDSGIPVEDVPSRFIDLALATDPYGTLLLSPLIQGGTGEQVPVSFEITFETQDLNNVIAHALPGSAAPGFANYRLLPPLTQRVIDNITQFSSVGTNAYEKAMAVKTYFQSTFELDLSEAALSDYPQGQEVTDWFLERGNGLPQHFATAYAVFMRYLGVPARVVSGYALGDPDPVQDFRTVMVRHMTFWVEVYIPMSTSTEGEWIQVNPVPLRPENGGGENPVNTPIPDIQMLVWPTSGLPWAMIGTPFSISAAITVDGMPITTPDTVRFRDETDSQFIGTATIGQFMPAIANVTYTFPSWAKVGYHVISATWVNPYFSVQNATAISAVGTPTPSPADTQYADGFIISETQELNVSQGIDTYTAFWEDTVHVYGTMKVNGVPVNSSEYNNRYIQIMWDNTVVGNAFINEYGYYELNVYVDPMDHTLMSVGPHEVWSWYAGDWDGPIPRLLEARSSDNSTVTVWGRIGFTLNVTPTTTSPGGTIIYDGTVSFLNGTLLPSGQSVGVFFGTQANTTRPLNMTGGFQWSYVIPLAQPDGTYFARANWTNSLNWQYITGNWSLSIPIDVGAGGTNLWVNPLPDPLFIGQNVTIWGYLTHVANGSGIGGQLVDIWWSTGSPINLGPVLTASDGYFEINYTIPAGYEGTVEYWASFTSLEPAMASSELIPHLFSTIKRYDVSISILATPDPVRLLQTVTIQGVATLPENGSSPLAFIQIEIWWGNSTGDYLLGTAITNSTGGFAFYYQVPIGQSTEIVTVWAHYTSLLTNIADGESIHEPLSIEATTTLITVREDVHTYHLNETALLYGRLQYSNGTPIPLEKVFIHWVNASGTFVYEVFTDLAGNYQFQYNFSIAMEPGTIDVYVNWTSGTPLVADAFDTLVPSIQLVRYNVEIALVAPTQIYIDEVLIVQGILTFEGGTPPLVGETVYIVNLNGSDWVLVGTAITNSTGGFLVTPVAEYSSQFAVVYVSPDPLVNDYGQLFTVTRIKYPMSLAVSVLPNPVKLNETVTIHVFLHYQHNGTPLANAIVSIYWDNGTVFFLGNVTTDGTGQADFYYSGMGYDTVWTNIEVYGNYAGTALRAEVESIHTILTLEQWLTEVYNLNTDQPTYRLTETVVVTGNLRYMAPSVPYAGVTVELLLSGVPLDSALTASDGSFVLFWTVPQDTPVGFYDLVVRFQSAYPWIADSQAPVPQIEILAPGYLWISFTVSPSFPTEVYILQYLQISGTVTWDNGSFYSNSGISLFWGDPLGTWYFMKNVTTNAVGDFTTSFQVLAGTPTGNRQVWAYIYPAGYATFGMSPTRDIIISTYSVIITASVDKTIVHLGEQITFSGTAVFSNSTPLNGYDIEIWWNGVLLSKERITAGTFAYTYAPYVPYSMTLGVKSGYAFFKAPTAAFVDVTENFPDVTVREYVDLYLDTLSATTVTRGGTLIVEGHVTNDGSLPADGVTVEFLVDGMPTGITGITGSDGRFSINLDVPPDQATGNYSLTIDSTGPYHDVLSSPSPRSVSVYRDSVVDIMVTGGAFMPGEHLNITLELHDDLGNPISGATIDVFFNNTKVAALFLPDGNGHDFNLVIPTSWTGGSGIAIVRAEYNAALNGEPFTNDYSAVAVNSVHIFTDVQFSLRSAARIDPGQPFVIEVALNDPNGRPIENRAALLNLNETNTVSLTTDSNGRISYTSTPYSEGTVLYITVTLTSSDISSIVSREFTIRIQTQGGFMQGTDLLIAGILLVGAVIAVLAYLYVGKGMFRSTVISRGVDIPTKLRNIKKLADAGKYGASITLAYRTFEQMCGTKMGSERTQSETAREYLDRVLQSIPLDASTVEQFVQTYEEARFSHHEMTRERYEAALRVFTDLYPRIDSSIHME
jgi:transglutaminase-like putative cysteine protease/protocatechuate 3,4-dioxygenase beta subunit